MLHFVATYEECVQPSHTEITHETDKVQNDKTHTYIITFYITYTCH